MQHIGSKTKRREVYAKLGVKTFMVTVENGMQQYGANLVVDLDSDRILNTEPSDAYWIGKSYYTLITRLAQQYRSLCVVEQSVLINGRDVDE